MGRILFWVILAVVIYAAFVFARKSRSARIAREERGGARESKFPAPMIECPECGTYFPEDEAVLGDGKAYCSERCRKKARARKERQNGNA